ncbi:aspartate--tRNA(Asn) ligase [Candidatus Micrarchaeota archaeon CG_4_10_14_0_2_um_filter_60_11]|nr:MAG: aspartate--tRNA(Asn) ligase [Candidatus Micrarchaeota archaeon CG1_02_60_51]PIZ91245.1 MAG: aspartate--tRNA(Asn) ligase [Candidatus Micrarchaeota archaeon CG_4_10_14_0_2_um_filter_60_11]
MRTHYVKDATDGETVTLAGWVHELRDVGKIKFLILRDKTGLMQLTMKGASCPPDVLAVYSKLVKETAITATGIVKKSGIASLGLEMFPTAIQVVGEVFKQVPFELTGKVPADLDVRLDNRFVDLRRIETSAVFKIRSEVQRAFREKCVELGCQEINTPSIVGSSTEGGADLFKVKYFEKDAFLAQSPQLYKQLAVIGGMDKVFMTVPVFRAEKHNTLQHLNEVTQMDVELGFADDNDALDYLETVFLHILASVKNNWAAELKTLGAGIGEYDEIPRYTYTQAVDALANAGMPMEWGSDFTKEAESKIPEALGADLFFITRWPTQCRAFYSMPLEENPAVCKAYDLVYKGLEIASGAQRIHHPDLLVKQLKAHDLKPANFESYIDAFRYGAIPHAGWSIGSERLTMQLCGLHNIREASLFPRDRHRLHP